MNIKLIAQSLVIGSNGSTRMVTASYEDNPACYIRVFYDAHYTIRQISCSQPGDVVATLLAEINNKIQNLVFED
jgi:hypothetical protein